MPNAPGDRQRASFLVLAMFSVAATALLVIGSLWLAARLRGNPKPAHHTPVAEGALRTALAVSESYLAQHGSWAGLRGPKGLGTELPRARETARSKGPREISVAVLGHGSALVLTAMETPLNGVPPADQCLGVLVLRRTVAAPVFPAYPVTDATGTYYFVARLSGPGHTCDALVVQPAAGPYLSASGFPNVDAPSQTPIP